MRETGIKDGSQISEALLGVLGMWSELPAEKKNEYKRMMMAFASLTALFAQKSDMGNDNIVPILNSKFQEAMFQKIFNATAEDNGNTSYDASLNIGNKKYLIGIKTFQYNNNDQKIAQFKANHDEWAAIIDVIASNSVDEHNNKKTKQEIDDANHKYYLSLAKEIATKRNLRIASSIANLQGFNVTEEDDCESVYHVLMTSNEDNNPLIIVGETTYDKIDIDNIEIIGCTSASNPTNFYFEDRNHRYKYTSADSQLSMNFRNREIRIEDWSVKYASNAYQLFSDIANKVYGDSHILNSNSTFDSSVPVSQLNEIESYSWSLLNTEGEVELFSGLNSFYGVGSRLSKDKREKTVNDFLTNFSSVFKDSQSKEYFRENLISFLCENARTKEERIIKANLRSEIIEEAGKIENKDFQKRISKLLFRPMYEVYIPIPSSRLFHELHPNFFTPNGIYFKEKGGIASEKESRIFTLIFEPSGNTANAFINQDWGKGIETDVSMEILGQWILRKVFQLKEYEPLTSSKLNDIGINGIRLYKTSDSDAVHFEFIWIDRENFPSDYWS